MTFAVLGWQDAHVYADAFAKELASKGFPTIVYKKNEHRYHPCVQISLGRWSLIETTEYIYVAPDEDSGVWWFWWSSLEPIAPAKEVSAAAAKVARVLAAIPDAGVRML